MFLKDCSLRGGTEWMYPTCCTMVWFLDLLAMVTHHVLTMFHVLRFPLNFWRCKCVVYAAVQSTGIVSSVYSWSVYRLTTMASRSTIRTKMIPKTNGLLTREVSVILISTQVQISWRSVSMAGVMSLLMIKLATTPSWCLKSFCNCVPSHNSLLEHLWENGCNLKRLPWRCPALYRVQSFRLREVQWS